MEQIQRAILNNEPHHHYGSITDMYQFREGRGRARYPHLFSRGRVTGDESDFEHVDHSDTSTMDAMMRNVPTTQTAGDAFSEDFTGHSIERPPTDVRIEDGGMSRSSNGNAVTSVAPIDAIVPHPESYLWADEAHPRPESNEERDRVLRGIQWVANDPESQIPYNRNQRLLFHINKLMEIVRSFWHTEDPDTWTSQEGRNDSNTSLGSPQAKPSASHIPQVRPEGDSRTSNPREGGVGREEVGGTSCRKRPQLLKGMLNVKTSNRGSTTLPSAIPTSVPLSLFDHHRLSPHNAETSHGDGLANYYQILRTSKGFRCIMGRRDLDVCQFNLVYVS